MPVISASDALAISSAATQANDALAVRPEVVAALLADAKVLADETIRRYAENGQRSAFIRIGTPGPGRTNGGVSAEGNHLQERQAAATQLVAELEALGFMVGIGEDSFGGGIVAARVDISW